MTEKQPVNPARKKLVELVESIKERQERLTKWELGFFNTLEEYVDKGKDYDDLTAAQQEVCRRIDYKIHAAG